jgi:hypothetical protein
MWVAEPALASAIGFISSFISSWRDRECTRYEAMLDIRTRMSDRAIDQVPPCAQCGDGVPLLMWSERLKQHCVRNVWRCEACDYEFETTIHFRAL